MTDKKIKIMMVKSKFVGKPLDLKIGIKIANELIKENKRTIRLLERS